VISNLSSHKKNAAQSSDKSAADVRQGETIRFDFRKDHPSVSKKDVLFVQSAGHYIKALIRFEGRKMWATRHCSFQEMVDILSDKKFMVLGRFYLVNVSEVHDVLEEKNEKNNKQQLVLFFDSECKTILEHEISPYVTKLLPHK